MLNLKVQNEALLLKFLDKFYNKVDTPWVTLLWNSYYTNKVPHAIDPCGSFWWKNVFKLSPIFRGLTSCVIGSGNSALLWKDLWLDEVSQEKYPRAYSFCQNEDISLKLFMAAPTLAGNFHLPLSPEALQEVRELQQESLHLRLQPEDIDQWVYPWGTKYTSSKYILSVLLQKHCSS